MAKIAFDVKFRPQIESGEYKVETRDGRPVRIICWDAKGGFPIVSLVESSGYECYEQLIRNTEKGYLRLNNSPDCCDLFIVTPEPELTEFEEEICKVSNLNLDYSMKDEIHSAAAHILDLARKQIEAEKKSFKRLPTIEEWKWLIENCEWKWDDKRKGQIITARNGNSIFLPAAGYRYSTNLYNVGYYGYYWSSSLEAGHPDGAYHVNFGSGGVYWYGGIRYYGQSVRPVSDTPMEGFVDMGNNLFWAERNEEGYFTYDEAMKLFEK